VRGGAGGTSPIAGNFSGEAIVATTSESSMLLLQICEPRTSSLGWCVSSNVIPATVTHLLPPVVPIAKNASGAPSELKSISITAICVAFSASKLSGIPFPVRDWGIPSFRNRKQTLFRVRQPDRKEKRVYRFTQSAF